MSGAASGGPLSGGTGTANGAVSSTVDRAAAVGKGFFNDYHFSSFMAMEVPVTVVPRFSMDRVDCLGGNYGPFTPNYPLEVPLWLALHLRQTDTCTITAPPYLRVAYLRGVVEREQSSDSSFEPLPFYFYEVAKLMCGLRGGSEEEDVPHVAEVVRLVNDIKALRQRKLQQSMAVFEAEGSPMFIPGIKLTNIVSNELHYLRHSFAQVLRQACAMDQQRQSTTRLPTVASVAPTPVRPSTTLSGTSVSSSTRGGSPSSVYTATTTTTTVTATTTTTPAAGGRPSVEDPFLLTGGDATLTQTSTATASTATGTTAMTPSTATARIEVPLEPPVLKKRRTLRQT